MSGAGESEAVALPESAQQEQKNTQEEQQSNGQEKKSTEEQSSEKQAGTDIGPLEDKILRQIEYYFGDRNLPRDKFLQQAVANGEDGYVPIATLLTFNRLKALSSNEQLIAEVVKKRNSSLVQVNGEGTSIRRHPDKPLPDIFSPDLRKIIKGKTVYTKVFPDNVTLDQLQTFFGKFGKVEHIQMLRYGADEGRKFKGSVFVEFESKESADTYLQAEEVEFEGVTLTKESKESYFQRKNEKKKAKKALEESGEAKPPSMVVKEKNTVLHFCGCGANPTWESMKEALSEHATVAFVDFSNDERTEGYVRFKDEDGATLAVQALNSVEGGASLLGAPTIVRVLEGEEELEYWTKVEANKKAKAGKGRGGQKRKARDNYRPSARKQAKTED